MKITDNTGYNDLRKSTTGKKIIQDAKGKEIEINISDDERLSKIQDNIHSLITEYFNEIDTLKTAEIKNIYEKTIITRNKIKRLLEITCFEL